MVTVNKDKPNDEYPDFCSSCGKEGDHNEQENLCEFCFSAKNNIGSGGSIAIIADEIIDNKFGYIPEYPEDVDDDDDDDDSKLLRLQQLSWLVPDGEIFGEDIEDEEVEESQSEIEEGLQRYAAGIKDGISDELRAKEETELIQEYQKWIDQSVEVTGKPSGPDIEWAEDDDEVLGDHIENKKKDDSGHDLSIEEQEVSGPDNIFVHISEQAKTVVYKLTAKDEGSMPLDDMQKIQWDIVRKMGSVGVDLDNPQSVDLFIRKFREFDERLFEEFEKNFNFLCNMIGATEIAAQGFSDIGSDVSEKNDGVESSVPKSAESRSMKNTTQEIGSSKVCFLCDKDLPAWWEDVFYWGKDNHRKQCKHCGKCLEDVFMSPCPTCLDNDRKEEYKKAEEEDKVEKEKIHVAIEEYIRTGTEPEYPALSEAGWSLTIAIVSGIIGFMSAPAFVVTFIAGWNWLRTRSESQYSIEREAQAAIRIRREKREEEQRIAERAREREECRKRDEEAYVTRRQLRTEIEKMPKYSNWRNAVFARCDRACEMCGETKGLEIHHRVSFDAIQRAYKINTIVQAFDCDALWNVSNGSVLCKQCHEKMESSKYRNLHS